MVIVKWLKKNVSKLLTIEQLCLKPSLIMLKTCKRLEIGGKLNTQYLIITRTDVNGDRLQKKRKKKHNTATNS